MGGPSDITSFPGFLTLSTSRPSIWCLGEIMSVSPEVVQTDYPVEYWNYLYSTWGFRIQDIQVTMLYLYHKRMWKDVCVPNVCINKGKHTSAWAQSAVCVCVCVCANNHTLIGPHVCTHWHTFAAKQFSHLEISNQVVTGKRYPLLGEGWLSCRPFRRLQVVTLVLSLAFYKVAPQFPCCSSVEAKCFCRCKW